MKSRKIQLLLTVFLGLFLILTPLQVLAQSGAGGAGFAGTGGALSAITNFTIGAVRSFIGHFVTILINEIVAPVTIFFIGLLNDFIRQTNYSPPQPVQTMWGMMRNFVNIFFILILIVMAYGTIFDIQKYKASALLPRFLVAAVLINFSFVIGTFILDIGNGLSGVFLDSMRNILNTFGQGLSEGKIAAYTASSPSLSSLFIALLFLAMTMFSFAVVAIFVIVRIPFIWFLLIVSPVAWIGSILPNFRAQAWENWWKQFIGWTFFLPTYLFFLMFASMFVNAQIRIVPAGAGNDLGTRFGNTFQALGVNDIFMFVITIIFMVGGLGMAMKMSFFTGTQAASIFGKIEGGVGRFTGRVTGYSAAKKGLIQTKERVKEEGLSGRMRFLYGGERAERLKAARVAQVFGARGEVAKVKLAETNKEAEKLRQIMQSMTPEKAQDFLNKERQKRLSGVRGDAAVLEYAKQGYSGMSDYAEATRRFGGENTLMGREHLKNIKDAKFSNLFSNAAQELAIARGEGGTEVYRELRRALAQDLAGKDQITNPTDFALMRGLLENVPKELRAFIGAIKAEVVYGTRESRQEALRNEGTDPDLAKKLINFMKEKKEINNIELLYRTLERLGNQKLGEEITGPGRNTTEGRNVINEINKFNPIITIEMDYRIDRRMPLTQLLSPADQDEIAERLAQRLSEKEHADIKKMSKELFQSPIFHEAVRRAYDSTDVAEMLKGAPRYMREALRDLTA